MELRRNRRAATAAIASIFAVAALASAQDPPKEPKESPPAGAKSLEEVIQKLDERGLSLRVKE